MTETYVNYETAKLLKDKGFPQDIEGRLRYASRNFSTGTPWNSCDYKEGSLTAEGSQDNSIARPRLSLVHKWLIEAYNIFISITCSREQQTGDPFFCAYWERLDDVQKLPINGNHEYSSYDDALSAAIDYCVTNII